MQKFEKLLSRADGALADIILTEPSSSTLSTLIKIFDDQILEVSRKALTDIQSDTSGTTAATRQDVSILPNPLIVNLARLHIHSYYFYEAGQSVRLPGLVDLYSLVCQFVDQATEMDRKTDWALYSSESYGRHLAMIAAIILRISHSQQLKSKIDGRQGERAFFAVVKLLKRRSLQIGDVNAQLANVFSQLWHSDYCFKLQDGSYDSLHIRTRGRGVRLILLSDVA